MEKIKVAIIGMGTVGSGVARLLLDHSDRAARHTGRELVLDKAVVHDLSKPRDLELPAGMLTDDLEQVLKNPEIRLVAMLVGGLEPARTFTLRLLEAGKDVVTANKALLAEHGSELFDRARALGRCIAFEAAVAGGIPIIANISQCLAANQILGLEGILNGTSNFIIDKMDQHGWSYDAALREAQKLGFAEADPSMDVDGSDAAQKLAILAHLAFGARVHWQDIARSGIDSLNTIDLGFASELGYRIKLIAHARLTNGQVELSVSPTLVRKGHPLAEVHANYNAISLDGDAVGDLFFHGQGAGQMPTASAVAADLIDVAVGRARITFQALELWSDRQSTVNLAAQSDLPGRFYLRLEVLDQPGVMAQITKIMSDQKLSIASIIQHESDPDSSVAASSLTDRSARSVSLVIMTHETTAGAVDRAVGHFVKLPVVTGNAVRMRVLETRQKS
ncbi:MAG: homoserine dehydrogenase [Pirellulaceae bacterium]|nr:homoserine dehydrogenase [Pirellulaceae bacterium]